jgi:hypothetical protein
MSGGSDSGAQRRIPSTTDEMVREMFVTLSVSRPGQPCVVEMLRDGQRRMDDQDAEVERLREIAEGADSSSKALSAALDLHVKTPQEKPLSTRLLEAALISIVSVSAASLPAFLAWGVLWRSAVAMKAFEP